MLKLKPASEKSLRDLQQKQSNLKNESNMMDANSDKTPQKDMSAEPDANASLP